MSQGIFSRCLWKGLPVSRVSLSTHLWVRRFRGDIGGQGLVGSPLQLVLPTQCPPLAACAWWDCHALRGRLSGGPFVQRWLAFAVGLVLWPQQMLLCSSSTGWGLVCSGPGPRAPPPVCLSMPWSACPALPPCSANLGVQRVLGTMGWGLCPDPLRCGHSQEPAAEAASAKHWQRLAPGITGQGSAAARARCP